MTTPTGTFRNVKTQREIDGGHSGSVTVTAAAGHEGTPVLVFVDSTLLGSLMLTPEQAAELADALTQAAEEGMSPAWYDVAAFETTFGREVPPTAGRTVASLKRHVRRLSKRHAARD